ncbi:hypothetical protein M9435_004535 [Picochlorum sp. BPE23]|nr:hypothetical protein M9435_004535 [Picochlorum sp. BPE23]
MRKASEDSTRQKFRRLMNPSNRVTKVYRARPSNARFMVPVSFFQAAPLHKGQIKILQITSALHGPHFGGGIATAITNLALHLSDKEYISMSVLYCAPVNQEDFDKSREYYLHRSISLYKIASGNNATKLYGPSLLQRAYYAYEWLLRDPDKFDIIMYHDYMGTGYYVSLAKTLGLYFQFTTLIAQGHSTIRLADIYNYRKPKDTHSLLYYFIEQKSYEMADIRTSPSKWYLNWMESNGYKLPLTDNFVVQNTLYPPTKIEGNSTMYIRTIAFFGRLEVLKGLFVFFDALNYMLASGPESFPSKIFFIGPSTVINGTPVKTIIESRSQNWPSEVSIHELPTIEAIDLMKRHSALVVCPSLAETMSYAVLEAISSGLPVVSSNAGGIPELFGSECNCLAEPGNATDLAEHMIYMLNTRAKPPILKISPQASVNEHINLIKYAYNTKRASRIRGDSNHIPKYRVTVGITSYNRPEFLYRAVTSILKQTYPKTQIEILIVDDQSDSRALWKVFEACRKQAESMNVDIKITRNEKQRYVSHSRNNILKSAKGDLICMFDDDDYARPKMLETYVKVAFGKDVDVVTDFTDVYKKVDGQRQFTHKSLSVGNSFASNFFMNFFGKANFCIKRKALANQLKHYEGKYQVSPFVDWNFFFRASLQGLTIESIPLSLYEYTANSKNSIYYTSPSESVYKGHMKFAEDAAQRCPDFAEILAFCRLHLAKPEVTAVGVF